MTSTHPRKHENGPVNAQVFGGPHDGTSMAIPCLRPYLELPDLPHGSSPGATAQPMPKPVMIRYQLDPSCVEGDELITEVARYLYRPRVPTPA